MPRTRTPLYLALRKRSEALASIQVHKRWIAKLEDRVRELEGVIQELGGFPQPKNSRLKFDGRGLIQKRMYRMLREQGHVTAPMLAKAVMEEHVPKPHKPSEVRAMRERAYQCIRRNLERGTLRFVGGVGTGKDFKRYALALRK
jgi:hypothetical protein